MRHKTLLGLMAAAVVSAGLAMPAKATVMTDGYTPGEWTMDLEAARAYAEKNKIPLFIAFSGSDWCGWCKRMDKNVFQTGPWKEYAKKNLALVMLDFPKDPTIVPDKYKQRNNQLRSQYGARGFPTYVLVDAKSDFEIGRFGASAEMTAPILIAQIQESIETMPEELTPAQTVSSEQQTAILNALQAFDAASPEERGALASKTLTELTETLTKDPLLLVLLEPKALIEMVPYLNLADLKSLADLLNKARKTGTPIDPFQTELEQLAEERKDDLSTIRGLMFLYSSMDEPAKSLALLPELEVLKQVDTPARAKELISILRGVGKPKTALELAFHMQQNLEDEKEKKAFCVEILGMAGEADDSFLSTWLTAVTEDAALTAALQEALGQQAAKAGSVGNAKARSQALMGHARIVNLLGLAAGSRLARQYLRYWQFEFATALGRSRIVPKRQPYRSSRPKPAPPFVPFNALLASKLSRECVALLPREEAELHRFQLAVSRMQSGVFDENALMDLTSFAYSYPDSVARHCADFIEDWGKKVNPNKSQGSRGRPVNQRGGIPLTRARQEKNIADCARMFQMMRTAGVKLPDDVMLMGFRSCFSRAEIVSREDVLRVFPEVASLSDRFIVQLAAEVVGELRENWMNAENRQQLQQEYATNRTEKDIDNETVRAYRGMIDLVRERLALSEDSIPLRNVMAALSFDLAEFSKAAGLASLEEYTDLRDSTFRMFEESYNFYQAGLPDMAKSQYSVDFLKYWFSAVFGASELGAVTVNMNENPSQLERIRATLDGMEESYRDAHKRLFGEWIVSQWGQLKPHVKLNVLQSTLEVLGDHESVEPLVKRMSMYKGLLKEVELKAEVDGPTRVGVDQSFGLVVKLRHTDALEREAGGFSKYIQNQQPAFPGSRERIDYRNNFARNINEALKDHFEVTGITWMDHSVHSVASQPAHWRETPLAYISLKVLDATVDRIPSIQLDLVFRDDTNQVVLPILSNTVIINAESQAYVPRPVNSLQIRLILDARQAAEGDLKLHVKMKGEGVLPPAETILQPAAGYSLGSAEDAESLVLKVEQRGREVVPFSEQNVTLPLTPAGLGLNQRFTFPEITIEGASVTLEQYRDADIVPAKKTVTLEDASAGKWAAALWAIPILVVAGAGLVGWLALRGRHAAEEEHAGVFALPAEISGLSVLSLLERIRRSGCLISGEDKQALEMDVRSIEEACFSADRKKDIDLRQMAVVWLGRVS